MSGGENGTVRVWDIHARCCTFVLRPWATNASSMNPTTIVCPISSILVLPKHGDFSLSPSSSLPQSHSMLNDGGGVSGRKQTMLDGMGIFSNNHRSPSMDLASMIQPLQRFSQSRSSSISRQPMGGRMEESMEHENDVISIIRQSLKNETSIGYWDGDTTNMSSIIGKRSGTLSGNVHNQHIAKRHRLCSSLLIDPLLSMAVPWNGSSSYNDSIEGGNPGPREDHPPNQPIMDANNVTKLEDELTILRKELGEANTMIERWQSVNSKLVIKLKKLNPGKA